MKLEYHCKESCNRCGESTKIGRTDEDEGLIHECETECKTCGFIDFWAHGFFISMTDGFNECKKYYVHSPHSLLTKM